jgi:N-acetylmuramic acid 6-phosphate etherase
MERLTEQPSKYHDLEKKSVDELVMAINGEDQLVAMAIKKVLPDLSKLISAVERQLKAGGRMFYLGCGSGGRLAVLDAIELPNTYGIEKGLVNVVLGGGVENLVAALEEKEDDLEEGWNTLLQADISSKDIVIGISASGTTPYVLAALKQCKSHGIPCGSIVHNPQAPISRYADYPVEVVMGPEFITGSTRMKCGTAQKMIFDMISTTVMVRLGRVEDNRMICARLTNDKVTDRLVKLLMLKAGLTDYAYAKELLIRNGNVKKSIDYLKSGQR